MRKPDGLIKIPCSLSKSFFLLWYEFLKPFHKLTEREMEVAASFTKHRYELSKVINDDNILDSVAMNDETKKKVREECGISLPFFQVIMSKLRKNGIIINERLNPRFIPNIKEGENGFILALFFDFSKQPVKNKL